MKWPFVSRAKYEAALMELEAERKRARRRERRRLTATVPLTEIELPSTTHVAVGSPHIREITEADIPAEVVEAIEARAGSLGSRVGQQMMRQASKALKAGEHPDRVAAWMLRGDE